MSADVNERFLADRPPAEGDPDDPSIEDRLRNSAHRILAPREVGISPAGIIGEHLRRERRFRARRNAVLGVAVGVFIAAAAILTRADFDSQKRHASRGEQGVAPPRAEGASHDAVSADEQHAPSVKATQDEPVVGIPLFVAIGEWEGRPVVTPALYVPPHARRLDRAALTPAERMAVERLLGLDAGDGDRDTTL